MFFYPLSAVMAIGHRNGECGLDGDWGEEEGGGMGKRGEKKVEEEEEEEEETQYCYYCYILPAAWLGRRRARLGFWALCRWRL